MAISSDVLGMLIEPKDEKGESTKKRYIPFLLEEWEEKINKPLGRRVMPDEAKDMICNLLSKLSTGEWKLDTSGSIKK